MQSFMSLYSTRYTGVETLIAAVNGLGLFVVVLQTCKFDLYMWCESSGVINVCSALCP